MRDHVLVLSLIMGWSGVACLVWYVINALEEIRDNVRAIRERRER